MTSDPRKSIELGWADFGLVLAPAAGGSVAAFSWRGLPLFRSVEPGALERTEPLDLAGYPLIPFASRICEGRFDWRGRQVELLPNLPFRDEVIHGQSWREPWVARRVDDRTWLLEMHYAPRDWPWAYRASQRFTLLPNGLALTLSITNETDDPMPAGLGWHPYFHRPGARLTTSTAGRLVGPLDALTPEPHLGFDRADVDDLALDHCFFGWSRHARVEWPERGCALTLRAAAPLNYLTVWLPPDSDCFCIEPVSHSPNAANAADPAQAGWIALAPRATRTATVVLELSESLVR